jgi:hypothetical protein
MFTMKAALKHKKVYIIGVILLVVALAIIFGSLAITLIPELNLETIQYQYMLWIFPATYFLIGFFWADIRIALWRRKTKNWDSEVDFDVLESAWTVRWSFWLPAIALLAVALVFEGIALTSGGYPFL